MYMVGGCSGGCKNDVVSAADRNGTRWKFAGKQLGAIV